ncbi:MAG TPA: hypothetical protein VFK05_19570 [Polyangiaceae bacterium]|nr:hypothetical protein [Polyangiaceae bacterium]
MRRSFAAFLLLVGPLLHACAPAPAAPSPAHPGQTQPVPEKVAPAPAPGERLARALRSIPRPAPVLSALPASARSRLQERFDALDAQRKLAVQSDDGPLVESLPLLHLIAGGRSPRALYALATTSAGSDELSGLASVEPDRAASTPDAARVAIVRELATRAAFDFLRDRAADVALPGKGTALASRLVARAALTVARRDLVLGARELLLNLEPNLENRLEFAAELARSGEPARAAQLLTEAQADARRPPQGASLADTQRMIDAARTATEKGDAVDVATRLSRARAWLRLGRSERARALLEPEIAPAHARLDLAAALAETWIENPSCPGLPPDVGGAALCAVAFRSSDGAKQARALLEAAFQAGGGRDDEAIEVYTALAHIIPWMHDAAADLSQGALRGQESAARLSLLQAELAKIALIWPKIAGLELFLSTLQAPSSPSSSPNLSGSSLRSEVDARALAARALSLASTDKSRFAQAGVFSVAAVLAQQTDVTPLLAALPADSTAPSLQVPRAALEVWCAASTGSREHLEAARSALSSIMAEGSGSPLLRARLVLGVSEASALLDSSERSYQLLSRVAGQLLSDNIPPDLALRAVIDAAGALSHGERFEQATQILSGASTAQLPEEFGRARDFLALIRGYEMVLDARSSQASALPQMRAGFAALAATVRGQSASLWFELWTREFDARAREAECAKKKLNACPGVQALRRQSRRALDARLGPQASSVLLHGALPSALFEAGFRFTIENGLEPLIIFDPSVLSIGLPKFTAD